MESATVRLPHGAVVEACIFKIASSRYTAAMTFSAFNLSKEDGASVPIRVEENGAFRVEVFPADPIPPGEYTMTYEQAQVEAPATGEAA